MISVIIPTYNRLPLLKITLENIFQQSQQAQEIIVVDDHSSDGTYEYLKNELSDKVIALQTEGKGPGAARNTGVEVATGDVIQYFDSDDLMTLNKLEDQLEALQHTTQGMVFGSYVPAFYDHEGWKPTDPVLQYSGFHDDEVSFRSYLLRGWNIITQACLFDADLLKEVGKWREDLMTHEDKEYLFRLSKLVEKPAHTNNSAVVYRQHQLQVTDKQTHELERSQNYIKVLELMYKETDWNKVDALTRWRFRGRRQQAIGYLNELKGKGSEKMFAAYFEQVYNKRERYLTQTNWERMHGPNADPKVFERYIQML